MNNLLKHVSNQLHARLILLFVFLLIAGCSTTSHKTADGPPHYAVDVSKIPDAKPKVEPLSKLGNQTYHVFGKKYYVMDSSKNYVERGVASWYGTKFHNRSTSSGEQYDMLAMTAAHKSLPLPTYVEVTNLKNGRKVIVKVNDRGPFEANRIIDLSYAAAKKLDMVGKGTAYVEVRAINPAHGLFTNDFFIAKHKQKTYVHLADLTKKTSPKNQTAATYLQVGAFKNKSNAEKLQRQLLAMVSTPVRITQLRGNHLYRVQIGPIKNNTAIAEINRQLKSIGLSSKKMIV